MHSRFSCADCKDYRFLQTRTECLLCARSCPRHQNAEVNRTQSSRSGLSPRQDATCINGEAVCMLQRRTWPRPENSRAGDIGVGGTSKDNKNVQDNERAFQRSGPECAKTPKREEQARGVCGEPCTRPRSEMSGAEVWSGSSKALSQGTASQL